MCEFEAVNGKVEENPKRTHLNFIDATTFFIHLTAKHHEQKKTVKKKLVPPLTQMRWFATISFFLKLNATDLEELFKLTLRPPLMMPHT